MRDESRNRDGEGKRKESNREPTVYIPSPSLRLIKHLWCCRMPITSSKMARKRCKIRTGHKCHLCTPWGRPLGLKPLLEFCRCGSGGETVCHTKAPPSRHPPPAEFTDENHKCTGRLVQDVHTPDASHREQVRLQSWCRSLECDPSYMPAWQTPNRMPLIVRLVGHL